MIARWLRTARHLRPSQVLWRLRYATERRSPRALRRLVGRRWHPPDRPGVRDDFPDLPRRPSSSLRGIDVEDLEAGVFEHLGQRVEIGREQPDWRLGPRSVDRLWTVTLHYHHWAAALAEIAAGEEGDRADAAARLLRHYTGDWIQRCPWDLPGAAALAWNAYAVATRLESWIRAYVTGKNRIFDPAPESEELFLRSLWQQAAYLSAHTEWHLRGNHLLRDAVGLAWAGRFFDGDRPRAWLKQATRLAVDQVAEQVLADGGHFERSPGYHVEVMEDLLLLALLLEDSAARAKLRQTWADMAEYLAWMRHPDGDVVLFNDGSLRGAGAVSELLALGEEIDVDVDGSPRRGGRHFEESGIAVWHGDVWTFFFDVGSVGPDVQPGHAHAGTLTFEASCNGRRVVVDPGTYAYDDDSRRAYDRGTAAHNTVCVDGVDSSEMWQIFRVGRRAHVPHAGVPNAAVVFADSGMTASAIHDGYRHLRGRPRHQRSLAAIDAGAIMLRDTVTGSGVHRAGGGLLIEPSWSVEETAEGWHVTQGEDRLIVTIESAQDVERSTEGRPYHPRFGVERRATRIGWSWQGELPLEVKTLIWLK